jgi:quercetin dioxygenase-like cupin family protein
MPKPFVVTRTNSPRPLNVVGEKITVLASGDQTGGYEVFLQDGPPDTGPPPHSHPWDETFYVMKGDVHFSMGEDTQLATAGTLVHLPAGTVHWFRCGREGALMLSVTSRKGASEVFAAIDREISVGSLDVTKIIEVISANGVVPGPMPLVVGEAETAR